METVCLADECDGIATTTEISNKSAANCCAPELLQRLCDKSELGCRCCSVKEFADGDTNKDRLCSSEGGSHIAYLCNGNSDVENDGLAASACDDGSDSLSNELGDQTNMKTLINSAEVLLAEGLTSDKDKIPSNEIVESAYDNLSSEANNGVDYSCLELETIPPPLFSTPFITDLRLDYNDLTELPDHLCNCLTGLRFLSVIANNLSHLPKSISQLSELQELHVAQNRLQTLPVSIGKLRRLEVIDFAQNTIVSLPLEIGQLVKLKTLNGSENLLQSIPQTFGRLGNLLEVDLGHNQLAVIPNSFGFLVDLKNLNLSFNRLEILPDSLCSLAELEVLNVSNNLLKHLPDTVKCFRRLRQFYVANNRLDSLPSWIDFLPDLEELLLGNNELCGSPFSDNFTVGCPRLRVLGIGRNFIRTLPTGIVDLENLDRLDFGNEKDETKEDNCPQSSETFNWIWRLPGYFGDIQSLRHLNCYGVQLELLPDDFGCLKNLEWINLGANYLHDLPESFCQLPSLKYLDLSMNRMEILPSDFGCLAKLEELRLERNSLGELPQSFSSLVQLRHLNLFSNNLTELPVFLEEFQNLKYLNIDENCFSEETLHLELSGNRKIVIKSRIKLNPDKSELSAEIEWQDDDDDLEDSSMENESGDAGGLVSEERVGEGKKVADWDQEISEERNKEVLDQEIFREKNKEAENWDQEISEKKDKEGEDWDQEVPKEKNNEEEDWDLEIAENELDQETNESSKRVFCGSQKESPSLSFSFLPSLSHATSVNTYRVKQQFNFPSLTNSSAHLSEQFEDAEQG